MIKNIEEYTKKYMNKATKTSKKIKDSKKPSKKQIARVKKEVEKMKPTTTSEAKGYFRYWWDKFLKI